MHCHTKLSVYYEYSFVVQFSEKENETLFSLKTQWPRYIHSASFVLQHVCMWVIVVIYREI